MAGNPALIHKSPCLANLGSMIISFEHRILSWRNSVSIPVNTSLSVFMSPPTRKLPFPTVFSCRAIDLRCSRFLSRARLCLSVSGDEPDGAWTLKASLVLPPGPRHKKYCAERGPRAE